MDKITLNYIQDDGIEITFEIPAGFLTVTELLGHYANFTRAMGYPIDFGDEFRHISAAEIKEEFKSLPEEDEVGDGIND